MQQVHLLHNPAAGDEAHSKEYLLAQIQAAGYACRYHSLKTEGWDALLEDADIVAVAGGDGSVRKVVKHLLKKNKAAANMPLAVLALGTANNIAKSLQVHADIATLVQGWHEAIPKSIDIGRVEQVPGVDFFLEGFGFGIFPLLMKEMKQKNKTYESPEAELLGAVENLHRILLDYEPRRCHLEVDGTDHSGRFYMVEVMNIKSIGPNMLLAPHADPGDGELDVVLVPEAHKEKFSNFLLHRLHGGKERFQFHTLKGKDIRLHWQGTRLHADDEMLKLPQLTEVKITVQQGALSFMVPRHEPPNR